MWRLREGEGGCPQRQAPGGSFLLSLKGHWGAGILSLSRAIVEGPSACQGRTSHRPGVQRTLPVGTQGPVHLSLLRTQSLSPRKGLPLLGKLWFTRLLCQRQSLALFPQCLVSIVHDTEQATQSSKRMPIRKPIFTEQSLYPRHMLRALQSLPHFIRTATIKWSRLCCRETEDR